MQFVCVCVVFYFNYNKIKGTLLNLIEEYEEHDNGESCVVEQKTS